jgi:hypothetical protein
MEAFFGIPANGTGGMCIVTYLFHWALRGSGGKSGVWGRIENQWTGIEYKSTITGIHNLNDCN